MTLTAYPDPAASAQKSLTRADLARLYLRGAGLEIGALHYPLAVPSGVHVRYVDRLDVPELRLHYPELSSYDLTPVDILDDGETLRSIADASQNFVIANHVLEHCEDPIGTILTFFRVLKPEGMLFLTIPDKRHTFDRDRPVTPLSHLIEDHAKGPATSRDAHYQDWVRNVQGITNPDALKKECERLATLRYSIHFHVWTQKELLEFFHYMQTLIPLELRAFVDTTSDCVCILQK